MPIPLIIGAITSMLADKGLDLVSQAIEGGANKAVEFVSEKTGIDLKKKEELSKEDVLELQKFQKSHELELSRLALEKLKEENRHEETLHSLSVDDRDRASEMFKHSAELQTETAKEILEQTKWQIPLYIVLNVGLVVVAKLFQLDPTIVVAAGNLLGIGLTKAYEERSKITSFLFGAEIKKSKR